MRVPYRIDRYPAKMVTRLATELVSKYASDASSILDPFCGSGAILVAANQHDIRATGVDLNPIAYLLSVAKTYNYDQAKGIALCDELVSAASANPNPLPIRWETKDYWFTKGTLEKFSLLRSAARSMEVHSSSEGLFALLAMAMSVRLCSRADQRSPKPFISKNAIKARKGKHYDPFLILPEIAREMASHFRPPSGLRNRVVMSDIVGARTSEIGKHSHVITSPPYINAQDYFRNFKLELHILEGLFPFDINVCRSQMIGTERGSLQGFTLPTSISDPHIVKSLGTIKARSSRLAGAVCQYFTRMDAVIRQLYSSIVPGGTLVLVCGDNLIASQRIQTWQGLLDLAAANGFVLFDKYTDKIQSRLLPPKRMGHKGLIKQEVVLAFERV